MRGQRAKMRGGWTAWWRAPADRLEPGRLERSEDPAMARITALMALKRYEQPGAEVATRCRAAVLRRIRSGEPLVRPDEGWASGWSWAPVAGWGTAALLAGVLGLRLMTATAPVAPLADGVAEAPPEVEQMALEEGPQDLPPESFPAEWPPRIHRPTGSFQFIGSGQ